MPARCTKGDLWGHVRMLCLCKLRGESCRLRWGPQEIIDAAYQWFLQRDPDPADRSDWVTVLRQSGVKAVVGGTVHSVEWAQKHAPDATTAVNAAYLELLARPSDADGLAYWIGIVNSLGTNSMLDGFLNSSELLE